MTHIYIISDDDNSKPNRYKVGHHSGNEEVLWERYRTPIPRLNIHLLQKVSNAEQLEKGINDLYKDYCIKNKRGNTSEWYTGVTLKELKSYIYNNGTGIDDKIMFHRRLDSLELDPIDDFVLRLMYNTTNCLINEEIYTTPDEYLNMFGLAGLYMSSDKTGKYKTDMAKDILKHTVMLRLKHSLNRYCNSSILEIKNTKYKIKSGGYLYSVNKV